MLRDIIAPSCEAVVIQISSKSAQPFASNPPRVRTLSPPRLCVGASTSIIHISALRGARKLSFGEDALVDVVCTHTEFHPDPLRRLGVIRRGFARSHIIRIKQQKESSVNYLHWLARPRTFLQPSVASFTSSRRSFFSEVSGCHSVCIPSTPDTALH